MHEAALLDHFAADLPRMLAAVERSGLEAAVPGAPAWTVRELVEHVAAVFEHKLVAITTGHKPTEWKREDADPVAWLADAHARLLHLLTSEPTSTQVWTWFPPDQSVGFWVRRMAQELFVHRIDAEQAAAITPLVDEQLAADGVDEVLCVMLGYEPAWEPDDEVDGHGQCVAIQTEDGASSWLVTLNPSSVEAVRGKGDAVATVTATADELLLWLWGRGELDPAAITGDKASVGLLLEALAIVTE